MPQKNRCHKIIPVTNLFRVAATKIAAGADGVVDPAVQSVAFAVDLCEVGVADGEEVGPQATYPPLADLGEGEHEREAQQEE